MKKSILTISMIAALCVGVVFLLSSCKQATGGGWIPVYFDGEDNFEEPVGKATFGFQMRCETIEYPTGVFFTGEVQYNDHVNNVNFHGVGAWREFGPTCEIVDSMGDETRFYLLGTYSAGPTEEGGFFDVRVHDLGEPGADSEDIFYVELTGGVYHGYINYGKLGGGNIQVHPE